MIQRHKEYKNTSQISQASLKHLCKSKNKDGTSKESYISEKRQHIVDQPFIIYNIKAE